MSLEFVRGVGIHSVLQRMKHSTINQIIMWIAMLRGLVDRCSVDGGGAALEPTISHTTTHNNNNLWLREWAFVLFVPLI